MARSLVATIEAANRILMVEGDLDAIGQFFSADYVAHLTDQTMTGGHPAIRRVLELYRRAFTKLRVDVEVLMEGKDRLAWQRTLRGTQSGNFHGFPATGKTIVWREMLVSRFRDGLIVEDWFLTDLAEQLLLSRKNPKAKKKVAKSSRRKSG